MNVHTNLDLTTFLFPTPRLLDFPGAYSYFSSSHAPASRFPWGLFLLFFLLRPGFLTSPGLILTFLPPMPRLLDFPGTYSYFSFSHPPASWLPRGLFLLFFLSCPNYLEPQRLIFFSDTLSAGFRDCRRLLSGLHSQW